MSNRSEEILLYMPDRMRDAIGNAFDVIGDSLAELRFRTGKPIMAVTLGGQYAVTPGGSLIHESNGAYIVSESDIKHIFQAICDNSVYAYTEEIRQGFITVAGGHRFGFVGRASVSNGAIEGFREISSVNVRIAHEIVGAANNIMSKIVDNGRVRNTIIISPPNMGKTTLLRDIARQVSNSGIKVAIADDRGEIAAVYKGVPQNDVGINTDVIDNAPKGEAIVLLLRSMSPQVIISDEISTHSDANAVLQALGTGAAVIASAHGDDLESVRSRETLKSLFGKGGFEVAIVLSRENGEIIADVSVI